MQEEVLQRPLIKDQLYSHTQLPPKVTVLVLAIRGIPHKILGLWSHQSNNSSRVAFQTLVASSNTILAAIFTLPNSQQS